MSVVAPNASMTPATLAPRSVIFPVTDNLSLLFFNHVLFIAKYGVDSENPGTSRASGVFAFHPERFSESEVSRSTPTPEPIFWQKKTPARVTRCPRLPRAFALACGPAHTVCLHMMAQDFEWCLHLFLCVDGGADNRPTPPAFPDADRHRVATGGSVVRAAKGVAGQVVRGCALLEA